MHKTNGKTHLKKKLALNWLQAIVDKIFPLRKEMLYILKWAIGLLLLACAS